MGRPPKELPGGFTKGNAVKISSRELRGSKLGIVAGPCKYDDGGIDVYLTGLSQFFCVQTERGDTIVRIGK